MRPTDLHRRIAALVASPATLKRSARISPAASECAERLARIAARPPGHLGCVVGFWSAEWSP